MRDTHKYLFKVGNKVVHGGITNNLDRREREHLGSGKITTANGKTYNWADGHIVKVGKKVSRESGLSWERDNGYGANQ